MDMAHIPLSQLSIAAVNMRYGKKRPDIADILPSIRKRGVLVPLLVRPTGEPDLYEIVAGGRRYYSVKTIAEEGGEVEPLPCAIMAPGDDAAALEASLIENIARLDPDEVAQWETFTRLVKEGRTITDIAGTFGITERMVQQRLALGNLLPRIREAYRRDEIDKETIRHLTLATKAQQKDWLTLFADPEAYTPRGRQVKAWLFEGDAISTKAALFPLEEYTGAIISDLFGEERYFADTVLFWRLQNRAVAAKAEAYAEAGWGEVVILEPGEVFQSWEYEKTPKAKGGMVFIALTAKGAVEVHEGYLSRRQAKRNRKTVDAPAAAPARPEMTGPMRNYVDLHRHAAVRTALLDHPGLALRLMVAHAMAGSALWQVEAEPQSARNEATRASLAASGPEARFRAQRSEVLTLLGLSEGDLLVGHHSGDTAILFGRFLALDDADVLRVLAVIMGETLQAGTTLIDQLGAHLQLDMTAEWRADDAFFALLRDRQVVQAMLKEVAGRRIAADNIGATLKVQKQIVRDCLEGCNGRSQAPAWAPRWLGFPAARYTDREQRPVAGAADDDAEMAA